MSLTVPPSVGILASWIDPLWRGISLNIVIFVAYRSTAWWRREEKKESVVVLTPYFLPSRSRWIEEYTVFKVVGLDEISISWELSMSLPSPLFRNYFFNRPISQAQNLILSYLILSYLILSYSIAPYRGLSASTPPHVPLQYTHRS